MCCIATLGEMREHFAMYSPVVSGRNRRPLRLCRSMDQDMQRNSFGQPELRPALYFQTLGGVKTSGSAAVSLGVL
jgi:hypothetical protein